MLSRRTARGGDRRAESALFSAPHGIPPVVETVPLSEAGAACQKMLAGSARFRMLLTTA